MASTFNNFTRLYQVKSSNAFNEKVGEQGSGSLVFGQWKDGEENDVYAIGANGFKYFFPNKTEFDAAVARITAIETAMDKANWKIGETTYDKLPAYIAAVIANEGFIKSVIGESGDTALIDASENNGDVTLSASQKLKDAVDLAESAVQSILPDSPDGEQLVSVYASAVVGGVAVLTTDNSNLDARITDLDSTIADNTAAIQAEVTRAEELESLLNIRLEDAEGGIDALQEDLANARTEVAAAINDEYNRARGVEGDLTTLTTEAKDNLVAAINEVNAAAKASNTTVAEGNGINVSMATDETSGAKTYTVSAEVKTGEKVLSVDANGLQTTLKVQTAKRDNKTWVQLLGIGDALVSEFDAADFVKDGMLDSVTLKEEGGNTYLHFVWNTDSGKSALDVDVTTLIDIYTAGDGIAINDKAISADVDGNAIKIDNNKKIALDITDTSDIKLEQTAADGLKATIDTATWQVKSVDNNATNGINLSNTNGVVDVTVTPGSVTEGNQSVVLGGAVYTAIAAEETRAKGVEGDLRDLTTDAKDNLVAAINELDTQVGTNTMNITELGGRMTIAESNIEALNSNKADKATTLAGYGITDAYTKTETDAAIDADVLVETNRAKGVEGDLTTLTTDAKGNLVAAINELDAAIDAKNVSAEGDDYVSATAANNKVTVAATQSTKDSLALADSALQTVSAGGDAWVTASFAAKADNAQALTVNANVQTAETPVTGDKLAAKSYVDEKVDSVQHTYTKVKAAEVLTADATTSHNFVKVKEEHDETDRQYTYSVDVSLASDIVLSAGLNSAIANATGLATDKYVSDSITEALAWEVIE